MVDLIARLSVNFTSKRERIGEYGQNSELVAAYTLFYFPTNYAKFSWALSKIDNSFIDEDLEIIDLGCGPGTFLHAFKNHFPKLASFVGIERSDLMRVQAQLLWKEAFQREGTILSELRALPIKKQKRLLVLGHALNEMTLEEFEKYFITIEPDYLLFIEPETKSSFEMIKEIRKKLLKEKFQIHYPCPSSKACP